MTIAVANTTLTNTFEFLVNRTTELANAMSTRVITTDSNTTPGNATITGTFSANVYIVGNSASNTSISAPNTEQKSSGSYFLNANGSWTSIVANNGIIANSSGIFVNANTGVVVNAAGVFVNSDYIGTLTSNNATRLGGTLAASYVQNTDSRTLSGNLAFSGANVSFTGNVGIGTSSPTSKLHVVGDGHFATTGSTQITLIDTDNGFAASKLNVENGGRDFRMATPQDLIFETATLSRMRINSSGSIGIGTDSPAQKLHVNGNIVIESTLPNLIFAENDTTNVDARIRLSGGNLVFDTINDDLTIVQENIRIHANGNVGIGTGGEAAQKLTVDGGIAGTIVATQAIAETGTNNTVVMTPLRTKQAITENIATKANIASPTFTGTVAISSLNLGGTTVTDIATQAQAEAGTVNTVVMTPLRTAQAIAASTAEVLEATSGGDLNNVGTYAFLGNNGNAISPGDTKSGSSLLLASLFDEAGSDYMGMVLGSASVGSWRLMGGSFSGSRDRCLGIFLRIA
jgi:hypothetical protein